jgi:hypothetical protein
MSQSSNQRGGTEQWVGFAILLCLAVIAAGVYRRQFSFNPAVVVATTVAAEAAKTNSANSLPAAGGAASVIPAPTPEFAVMSAPESFGPDDVYNKIDGKADLYLTAGFVHMTCQRFALKATNDDWMEWFAYDMGALPQAFSVFSLQRRAEGKTIGLTPFAYQADNAIYFVSGRYYVEVVTAMPAPAMMTGMTAMAQAFVAAHPPGPSVIPELKWFPPENRETDDDGLQMADAFGFDGFTNVFTAKYQVPSGATNLEVLTFLEITKTAADAVKLRDAYRSFLLSNGGKEMEAGGAAALGKPINFMDSIEIVFAESNIVAGVHAAPDAASAAKVSQQLAESLRKGTP